MPVNPTYPGVYVQELPSGNQTITGVSTSVAAFIDYFSKGPMNTPVQVSNMGDVDRIFGGLDNESPASFGLLQFFRNGGQTSYVVRVTNADEPAVAASLTLLQKVAAAAPADNVPLLLAEASNPGAWGNFVTVIVDHDTGPPSAVAALFNLTATQYDANQVATNPVAARNLSLKPDYASFAPKVVANTPGIPILVQSLAKTAQEAFRPLANGLTGRAILAFPGVLAADSDFNVVVTTPSEAVTVSIKFAKDTDLSRDKAALAIQDAIRKAGAAEDRGTTGAMLKAAKVVVLDAGVIGSRLWIVLAPTGGPDDFVTAPVILTVTEGSGTLAADLGLIDDGSPDNVVSANVQRYVLGALFTSSASIDEVEGENGDAPEAADIVGSPLQQTGLFALDKVDVFNILCIPRMREFTTDQAEGLLADALPYCEKRYAFMIVDVPSVVSSPLSWTGAPRSKNCAIYVPAVQLLNPLNSRVENFAPSGTMAGVYAYTDAHRGVWKAPAGIEKGLSGTVGLAENVSETANANLNDKSFNCLRTFPVIGNVPWGARTRAMTDPDWKYVPVRRLGLYLELSIKLGLEFAVFEPNADPLWRQITTTVSAFLQQLFVLGAFAGTKPSEAYQVACDKSTTSPGDIDRGIVNVVVGYAPLKPAEFIFVVIQQIAAKAS